MTSYWPTIGQLICILVSGQLLVISSRHYKQLLINITLFLFFSADYPYINYYVINKPREEAGQFYTANKLRCHETLNAQRLGYSLNHSMDLYDEVSYTDMRLNIRNSQQTIFGRGADKKVVLTTERWSPQST